MDEGDHEMFHKNVGHTILLRAPEHTKDHNLTQTATKKKPKIKSQKKN